MKLTLRTLLAYIDNLLPQQDAEEFEALLSKNEAANNLCNRIRSVMTRPELGAPEVLDKGLHLDPNVTAEYLDNVLSSEESPEYERLCISSDRQLSEVSACHQILTVVQIEPAEVAPAWREKIYTAPERVSNEESVDLGGGIDEPAPASSGFMASLSGILSGASGILGGGQSLKLNLDRKAAPPVEKSDPIPEPPERPAPPAFQKSISPTSEPPVESPEDNQTNLNPQAALEQYAQMITPEVETQEQPRQNSLTWILSLAAMAALIVLFVVLFLGPRNKGSSEIAKNDNPSASEEATSQNSSTVTEEKSTNGSSKNELTETSSNETTPAKTPEPTENSNANDQSDSSDASADVGLSPAKPTDNPSTDSDIPDELPGLETDETPAPSTASEENLDSLPGLENVDAENETDIAPITDDDEDVSTEPDDDSTAEEAQPADESQPEDGAAEDNSLELFQDAPQKTIELGQFVKRKGVDPQLLAYKAHKENDMWRRMNESASVRSGDTLLAFPDYRPDVSLGSDARIRLVGPARVSISPKSTPDEIHLTLEYGRAILVTSKSFSRKIVIKCAKLPTVLEVNQPSVKVAFEADVLKPDSDPALTPAHFYGTISLALGKANLLYNGSSSSVSSPTFIDCQSGTLNPQGAAADWIQNETSPASDLEKRLTADKPLGVMLSEIFDSKAISKELRQTVLVSLSMIGQYSTLVEDFNKEDRYAVWMDEFIVLQNSVLKSQVNAQSALDELKKRYDDNGKRIYEILWKYHNDLSSEDMSALITDLRDETLCVRVAAYCLLKSRGIDLGTYKPTDLKKSETSLRSLENKYKITVEL